MLIISIVGLINCIIFTVSFISANKQKKIYKAVGTGKLYDDGEMSTSLESTETKKDKQILVDQEEIMNKIKKKQMDKFTCEKV